MRTWMLGMTLVASACGGSKPEPMPPSEPDPMTAPNPVEAAAPAEKRPPAPSPKAAAAPKGAAQVIVDTHNRYRAQHCASPLTWSTELAAVAQKWADTLKARRMNMPLE